jgi:hypothetical protein
MLLLATACAPSAAPEPAAPAPTGPLPGDNFAYVYAAAGTVGLHDTRTGEDRVLADDAADVLVAAPTPDGSDVAVAYAGVSSTHALTVELATGAVRTVRDGLAGEEYTAAWSPDGRWLGIGYRGSASSGILVREPAGDMRSMGCRASNRIMAWGTSNRAIVHGGTNHYTVSAENCATLATLQRAGKRAISYAANATRAAWFVDRSVTFQNRPQPQIIPELWIAAGDGSSARVIADYQSRPGNAVLSPDGRAVAYEVVSRRWANTTHIVAYDIPGNDYSFVAEEKLLGVPSDFNVCWAPDGRRFAHDRAYARRGAQEYTTRQVVVRDGTEETEIFDEVIDRPAAQVVANPPATCRWIGDRHVLVHSARGDRVIDVVDGEVYEAPAGRRILGVQVFNRPNTP